MGEATPIQIADVYEVFYWIYDISGKLITENNDLQLPSAINVNFLDAGIYIVNMNLKNGESISEKLMIP